MMTTNTVRRKLGMTADCLPFSSVHSTFSFQTRGSRVRSCCCNYIVLFIAVLGAEIFKLVHTHVLMHRKRQTVIYHDMRDTRSERRGIRMQYS